MKPLFIPLMAKYYDAFAAGTKDTEYRILGDRWNRDTCLVGRPVVLSRGYGKQNRLQGVVAGFDVDAEPWKMDAWRELYGEARHLRAACIKIRLSP